MNGYVHKKDLDTAKVAGALIAMVILLGMSLNGALMTRPYNFTSEASI